MARRTISLRLLTALAMSALLTFAAAPADAQKKGGVLRVGNLGEPPALDAHWTTASITETLTNHIYEGLYSLDSDNKPIPMLAESHTVSKDGLVYTFKLRQGVKFHNGKEMTSEDVVASLARWGKQSIYGKALFAQVAELRAVDKYTVEMKLKEKSAIVLISLAVPNNFGAIYPKEIAEKFPPEVKATEYVGTGPFKLAEWKPDQYIRMVRFDDYKSRSEKPNGYGGGKTAYVDEIRWMPVPEVATRVAQVETGELDFADDLNLDAYDRLKRNANVRPIVSKPYYWLVAVFNKKEGLMTNQKLRQAWQAAHRHRADHEERGGRQDGVLPDGLEPRARRDHRLAHQALRAALERAQQGQGQAAPAGGGLQEGADPLHDHPGVQVDVRLRAAHQAAARGRRLQHRPPGGGLGHPRQAAEQLQGVRRLHHRHGRLLRPDPPHLSDRELAGLDDRRGHPEAPVRAGARDRPQEAAWRSGSSRRGSSTRRCRSSATATSSACGPRATRVKGFNEKTERVRFYNVWLEK